MPKSVSIIKNIIVSAAPTPPATPLTADFDYTPLAPVAGEAVSFLAHASGGEIPYIFSWDFGDGTSYTGESQTFTFKEAGTKVVTLTVTDSSVTPPIEPPPFNFAVSVVPNFASIVQGGTVSPAPIVTVEKTAGVTGKTVALSAPNLPAGVSVVFGTPSGVAPFTSTITVSATGGTVPGGYAIELRGSDGTLVRSDVFTLVVTATPPAFSVDFSYAPQNPVAGQTVTFTAIPTGGAAPITYAWDFRDGGTGTGSPKTHAFVTDGIYSVQLTATDNNALIRVKTQDVVVAVTPPPPASRDPLTRPFVEYSIWELPLGASAVRVAANIKLPWQRGVFNDAAIIVMKPSAPMTDVVLNTDDWSGRPRCAAQGPAQFTAPIPDNFIVPGAGGGNTPNNAAAILKADGHTLIQGQPFTRCPANPPTIHYHDAPGVEDIYGTGFSGFHGGSHLSSLGGTIRLGELVPGGVIRHPMKIGLFGMENYYRYDAGDNPTGYRWPATSADSGFQNSYHGTTSALKMGALLALPVAFDLSLLETAPGKIIAQAFKDYGAYTVDDAAWSVVNLITEYGPDGNVKAEFQSVWNFPLDPPDKNNAWSRDWDKILAALQVIDNWDFANWQTVAASNGALGAGGGARLVPWAPPLSAPPSAAPPSAPQSLTATPGNTQVSLAWQVPASNGGSPITAYKVYRGTSPGAETLLTTLGNILTYVNTGLSNGTTYYYKVTAVNGAGESPSSNEASATPTAANTVPSAPLSLQAVAGDTQIILNWQAPASNGGAAITNYKVYRGTASGAETLLTTLGVVLTFTDTGLTNGTAYFYQVSAVNSVGEGPKSNEASATPVAPPAGAGFDQIVVVAMENRNQSDVYHNSNAPYLSGLADAYAFLSHWRSVTNPSQPNYVAVIGGSTFGITGDGDLRNINAPTIVDIIEQANPPRTWIAIAEDATGTGGNIHPPRNRDHFPFLSFTTITGSPARAARMVPGGTQRVIDELNAGTNFIWFTPNETHNMHSAPTRTGDDWCASWMPQLLAAMAGKRCLLLVWWDEAYTNPPYIYLSFAGTAAKQAFVSSVEYVHYSLLKLLESKWNSGSLGQGDVGAAGPSEVLKP